MTGWKRRFPIIVDSSDSDETAARCTDFMGRPQVSSDTGSRNSDDPESRKARKLAIVMEQAHDENPQVLVPTTTAVNPFVYAMQHGKFPDALPASEHPRPEPPELVDTGNLWNAVPPKTSQYLDLESAHVGSETSEGCTGTSQGSLSDEDFIDKETPADTHSAEDLQVLQTLFPKTFGRENVLKRSPQCRFVFPECDAQKDPVMVNGIIKFPVWKRGPDAVTPSRDQRLTQANSPPRTL